MDKAKGCEDCNNTGFNGRLALMEIFETDEPLEELIIKNERSTIIEEYLHKKGMRSLTKDGLLKVKNGLTSLEEIERAIVI